LCHTKTNIQILTFLNNIDTQLFLFLNKIHSPFFDVVFEWISGRYSWIPLYALLVVFLLIKFKQRLLLITPFIVLLIVMSDQTSVHLFKNVFMRLRPCHNPDISNLVHIVNDHCGGQYGFVSSHATNTFALAFFVGSILKKHMSWLLPSLLVWAAIVSYSRIYLGVHYPADVLCGALLGIIIAKFVLMLFNAVNNRIKTKPTS